ncbi:MAG TPA: methylmalonyl Co-A mutase-associated GTPase MeaB [Syntrophorhabdaceae bacterium]|nr:methylmalonyl Co-A mutase-associated GTPase MeaB [Syntrophorhabdaceae bacterium]HOL05976.1 methylmalonyl Co-A mutase-associated GTPase MeaB [Syntrophorhabdaceae bacterium]HON84969.1 methylmalonyl Co-A mutase-associated GTPase MeaB [Syntrophorhabdaceae bacterium]HOT41692.1 methylmalonyl Co-A mutase-associated GTPase MeaB [Syntrophorhabdaceae bacterium]HPC66616.1 methylmalonyl Co-A mutase-associated GTPase MeaB [Syntrophorhabdaceae bacterium]
MELIKKILDGNEASAARLISMIEEGKEEGYKAIAELFPHTGKAHIIGITGAPGAGKSTIIDKLAIKFSETGKKTGIIAIDPTSIKSNGALLGDRVRMRGAENIEGIFIRSMAHRGYPGGIARATIGAVYVLEGLGKDVIIIESVGAGQTEVQISSVCDTVITVFTPDYGDDVQLMKAGIIEIGDIIVINKSDMPGAQEATKDIKAHVISSDKKDWQVPVIMAQAQRGEGIDTIMGAVESHLEYLKKNNPLGEYRAEKLKKLMFLFLKEELWAKAMKKWAGSGEIKDIVKMVENREIDLYSAVSRVADIMLPD